MNVVPRIGMLPQHFADWFASRGWRIRAHQSALIDLAALPPRRRSTLHTLYISPLKALAVDVARNLEAPIAEMGLAIKAETRTGDTPTSRRVRQRHSPPDILLTTPEQLALLLANQGAGLMFANLKTVVLDELHAMHNSKRGDLLALG